MGYACCALRTKVFDFWHCPLVPTLGADADLLNSLMRVAPWHTCRSMPAGRSAPSRLDAASYPEAGQ